MHETNENQVAYRFCFQHKSELFFEGAKVTELRRHILNFIGMNVSKFALCYTLIFKDSCFLYI